MRIACCAALMLGCSADRAADGGSHDTAADSGTGIGLSGIVYQYGAGAEIGIEGTRICLDDDAAHCVTTNADGCFALEGLEPEQEALVTLTKPGFVPILLTFVTPRWSSSLGILYLTALDDLRQLSETLKAMGRSDIDPNGSRLPLVSFTAVGGLTREVRVHLEPDPGSAPFYLLEPPEIALDIPEGRLAVFGEYIDVPARDDYELVYEPDQGTCRYYPSALGGLPAPSGRSNAARVIVREGFMTYVVLLSCSARTQ